MHRAPVFATLAALLFGAGLPAAMAAPTHAVTHFFGRPVIYAGLQNGLVFRSVNGGAGWQEADTGLPSQDITAMAVGAGGRVYAGTDGSGVYTSHDEGETWQDANNNSDLENESVVGLAVDPRNDQRVYATTASGTLYRSTDGGNDWTSIDSPVTNSSSNQATSLAVDPLRPSTIFIGSTDNGVAVSNDGGDTWTMSDGIPSDDNVAALAFNPANPDVAFAAAQDGIYETIDGGYTWQQETQGIPDVTSFQAVIVNPLEPSHVLAGTQDGQFFRSTDGGSTWQQVSEYSSSRQINALIADPATPDTILAGTDDGSTLYTSSDDGVDWQENDPGFGSAGVLCFAASAATFSTRTLLPTAAVNPPYGNPSGVQYFSASHHIVRGSFLTFYNRYGGLRIFGLPLTEAFYESGRLEQYFERTELSTQGTRVIVSPLGNLLTSGHYFPSVPAFAPSSSALYFVSTQHSLSRRFLTFWLQHHGSMLFGAPISEPLYEQNGDGTGRTYLVQYFQNVRMEYHPELSGTRYEVTLGLIGRQYLQQRGWL